MTASCIASRWQFAPRALLSALITGNVLFLLGLWCMASTNLPPPSLALPLPQRLAAGLAFLLSAPDSLIPLTLVLTASGFLASKLRPSSAVAVALAGLGALLVGALWVPNPVVAWPISIMGDHTLPDLIGELFVFHIVPSPKGDYGSALSGGLVTRWQLSECAARFAILLIGWTACLVGIRTIDKRLRKATTATERTVAGQNDCETES